MSKVIKKEITLEEAKKILDNENKFRLMGNNTPEPDKNAFEKALRGSKCFLKHKNLV